MTSETSIGECIGENDKQSNMIGCILRKSMADRIERENLEDSCMADLMIRREPFFVGKV